MQALAPPPLRTESLSAASRLRGCRLAAAPRRAARAAPPRPRAAADGAPAAAPSAPAQAKVPKIDWRKHSKGAAAAKAAHTAQRPPRPRPAPAAPLTADPPGHKSGYVAIVGKPNAGKSTLLNALVGQKLAIVTAKPQTTRHRILGILSGAAHQAVLVDTPGVLPAQRVALDTAMMRAVRTALTQADVLCAVVDAAAAASAPDPSVGLDGLAITGEAGGPPLLVLLNKCDLLPPAEAERVRAFFAAQPGVSAALCASAATGEGVPALESWLTKALPLGPTLYPKDMVSEHPERFFVAEIVRERIFELYRQEVPYCTTVSVLEHREARGRDGDNRDFIRVRVCVERESQKPILLGRGGAAIKELSTSSRLAIEDFLQRPVYLELRVEVAEGWRDSAEAVEKAGINNPNQIS